MAVSTKIGLLAGWTFVEIAYGPHVKAILVVALVAACGGAAIDPGVRVQQPVGSRVTVAPGSVSSGPADDDDIDWGDTTFDGHGVKLYAQRWRPKTGEVRAVLVIHHGLADHSGRYAALALRLTRAGYAVWALDMRGHGRSAGARVDAASIDDFLDDLDAFMTLVRAREPGKPIYLFGHSLGGLISCLYTIERQPKIAGLLLSGPALAYDAPPLQAAAVHVIAAIAPHAAILHTPHEKFSKNKEVVADMNADPLIYQGKGTARTARAAIDGSGRVWAAPERVTVPVLVVAGTGDTIVAPSGGRDLVARVGTKDATLLLFDNFDHDLLHEPNGGAELVMTDLQLWLDGHVAGTNPHLMSTMLPAHLRGDRKGSLMSLDLDVRGDQTRAGSSHGLNGGLRFRIGRGGPIGYFAGLDMRAGALERGYFEASAYLLGLAVHTRGGVLVGATAGGGIGGFLGIKELKLPVDLTIEVPFGPTRLLLRGNLAWVRGGQSYINTAHGIADELTALVGVRLGRDLPYWAKTIAGTGPYLALTYRDLGGAELYGLALGVDLFGAE